MYILKVCIKTIKNSKVILFQGYTQHIVLKVILTNKYIFYGNKAKKYTKKIARNVKTKKMRQPHRMYILHTQVYACIYRQIDICVLYIRENIDVSFYFKCYDLVLAKVNTHQHHGIHSIYSCMYVLCISLYLYLYGGANEYSFHIE